MLIPKYKDMKNISFNFVYILSKGSRLLFLLIFLLISTSVYSQNQTIKLPTNKVAVQTIIQEIEKQTGMSIDYSQNTLNPKTIIKFNSKTLNLPTLLNQMLGGLGLEYKITGRHILIIRKEEYKVVKPGSEVIQSRTRKNVTGRVVDAETNEPIIGANVRVGNTEQGVISDLDGCFKISASTNAKLIISYIGYNNQIVNIADGTNFKIKLHSNTQNLSEVVVVGYGTQRKVTLTGAVSAINSSEIVTTKNENVQNMLTGKIPGIRVLQRSAEPGEFNNSFDIRGMGSPLIIIDGIPRDNMNRINSEDIESVSVLKDASAAIYGVRAANGVVLITTKRGKSGSLELNYDGNITWQNPSGMIKTASAVDWMTLKDEKSMHNVNGGTLPYSLDDIEAYRNGTKKGTDWWNAVLRNWAPQTEHTISATGGNDRTQFYLSAGYLYQQSFFKSNDLNYTKYNVRSNLTSKLTNRLTVGLSMSGIMDQKNQPYTSAAWIIRSMQRAPALQPIYANDNPNYLMYGWIEGDNPVAMMDADLTGYKKYNNKWFQSSANFSYDVPYIQGLTAKGLFSYDYEVSDNRLYQKAYNEYTYDEASNNYIPKAVQGTNTFRREFYSNQSLLYQFSLNYTHAFNLYHNVNALLLWEGSKRQGDNFYAQRELALNLDQLFAGNSLNQQGNMDTSSGALYKEVNLGLVGKLGYDYKSKYLAEFDFRYDGSSMFGSGHQWGFFPAASVGWRISEENFWKESKFSFINNMKFRGSYGKLGDDSASSYQFITGYTYPSGGSSNKLPGGYIFNGTFVNSSANKGIANQNITWYIAKTLDLGFDFEAWNGLLGVTFDYFNRNRTGLLATRNLSLPAIVGASLPQENLNGDNTHGYELEFSHRNHVGDLGYNLKGIFTFTRTKTTYEERGKAGNSYDNWRNNNNNRVQNIIWGYGNGGRYQSYSDIANSPAYTDYGTLPGDYGYQDWNGDGIISDLDVHPIGYQNIPLINFSLNIGANWKGFDLNMLFQGTTMQYNRYIEELHEPMWGSAYSNALEYFMNRWHPTNLTADPYDPSTTWTSGKYAYTGSLSNEYSEYNVHNSSYIRLKSLEIGYSLSQEMLKRTGIKNVRFYINGYNLFTIKNVPFDPEHSGSDSYGDLYPLNRTISFGVNIKL